MRLAYFFEKFIHQLLSTIQFGCITIADASGIQVFKGACGTSTHSVHMTIHDTAVYKQLFLYGPNAAGETYMKGYWDVDNLTKLLEIIIRNKEIFVKFQGSIFQWLQALLRMNGIFDYNNIKRAKKNILEHYDLGNEFFGLFLDSTMMYSCALYEPEHISLEQASVNKIDKICQQLSLQPSDHLLEIGTGWGGFAVHAASQYGCRVTTTTISDKQYTYVKEKISQLGLQDKIELLNIDYRKLQGTYDKIVSIEMIEAIGHRNFDNFFNQCDRLLKDNGLFFLQAILINDQTYEDAKNKNDFIRTYIFPGGCLPAMRVITHAIAHQTQFQLMRFQDIGQHYAQTLLAWLNNFNQNEDKVREQGFSEVFIRMWRYYFCYCIAAFRQNSITDIHALWQKRIA